MLVLTRKVGQELVIEDDIVVKVTRVKGNIVKLGVSAPREVRVRRGELRRLPIADDDKDIDEKP
jgi:carbon storage regulator CsrA